MRNCIECISVPRKVGQEWLARDQVLPLLDGLDEVARVHRSACIETINNYRREHGLIPIVICSRTEQYLDEQAERVLLYYAVTIQPLTEHQIDEYIASGTEKLESLRTALHDDRALHELAKTPLILSVMALIYAEEPIKELFETDSIDLRRQQVFSHYVKHVVERRERGLTNEYTLQQVTHWLSWLAEQMSRRHQTDFYLEQMQPDWLLRGWLRHLYPWTVRLTAALVSGLLVSLVLSLGMFLLGVALHKLFPIFPLPPLPIATAGFMGGLLLGLMNPIPGEIEPTEIIVWSLPKICRSLIKSVLAPWGID